MARTYVFLAAVAENRVYADGNLVGNTFPQNYLEFGVDGSSVTWTMSIRGVTGSPDSWTLEARFLDVNENVSGPQFSVSENVPFSPLDTQNFVRGGVAWGKPNVPVANLGKNAGEFAVVADNTDNISGSNIARVSRTVEVFNTRHKLQIRPTFTGGTNPGLVMTLIAQVND